MTTTEAAGLLGVSRPTLIKLLEAGEIGYSRPNSSRRIPLDQVLAYRDRRGQARRAILDELTADAVEMGMYGPARTGRDGRRGPTVTTIAVLDANVMIMASPRLSVGVRVSGGELLKPVPVQGRGALLPEIY